MSSPQTSHPLVTAELLELILAALPLRDLLLAQRVCKTWHSLICTSPTLQTLLFFQAPPSTALSSTASTAPYPFDAEDPTFTRGMDDYVEMFFLSAWTKRQEAFKRAEASWRRMHLCNPPVTMAMWRRASAGMMGQFVHECVVRFSTSPSTSARKKSEEKLHAEQDGPGITLIPPAGDKESLDLSQDGLRMAVLYDYLYGNICTGYMPNGYTLSFARGKYPSTEDVAAHAKKGGGIGLEESMRPGVEGDEREGLTRAGNKQVNQVEVNCLIN
ncbi:hypothetical protein BU23DRAFT_601380 [Bimuria novae-zelandiae CBS 107.79]|uniref:F-box domain-containing protein n=1 Tax=Bimuria novae-zelandiae CBS 107.79 TaxID=1447943 RepID=A0A6A5V157_9PLEO|nr:hypothetical protein BU23DRAFT_601380 [Bimuria novae-zelandiae CBS 107.79]